VFCTEKGAAKIRGSSLFFTFARDFYENASELEKDLHIVRVTLIDLYHIEHFDDDV